ncbi:MAG: YwaF family protein [Candidatus Izemoplasmatales bacterium]|nr:YwaF family protein [Candidatus Izemoplasmatales bacterium]
MHDFFYGDLTESIPWFSLTHILLLVGFFISLVLIWIFGPKLKNKKWEKWVRYLLVVLVFIFEWKVVENRILNGSIFRLPLCGIALYGLTYSVFLKKEKVFKIFYFYAFGTILTYFFFDTLWGLDRWGAWTYFGAHASIGWLAVYGYRVLGFKLTRKDLYNSMVFLAGYALISGYATYKYGGSDELFLKNPPVDFLNVFQEIHQVVYVLVIIILAIMLMHLMYLPIYLNERKR